MNQRRKHANEIRQPHEKAILFIRTCKICPSDDLDRREQDSSEIMNRGVKKKH